MCDIFKSCFASFSLHMCDMTHSYVWHDSFIRVTWLIHMCDMTNSCDIKSCFASFASSAIVTRLVHLCDMTLPYVLHDSFIFVTYRIHVWHDSSCVLSAYDMTQILSIYDLIQALSIRDKTRVLSIRDMTQIARYPYVTWLTWLNFYPYVTWLKLTQIALYPYVTCLKLTHIALDLYVTWLMLIYMWHDSCCAYLNCAWVHFYLVQRRWALTQVALGFIFFFSCIYMYTFSSSKEMKYLYDMSHSYVRHASCTCVTWLIHTCDTTHRYVWHDSLICEMTQISLYL